LDPLSACAVEDWVRRGNCLPVENVPVASIHNSYTPRKNKANEHHIQILAQSPLPLPPIVIHRTSMRVIDGVHRLRATELRGDSTIPARLFEGNDAEAFVLAVHLNVTHGLPLTLSERKAAARRVLESYPPWSDRSIGLIVGVSNKTVGKLRGCATEENLPVGSPAWPRRKGPPGQSGSRTALCGRIPVDESPRVAAGDSAKSRRFGHHRARRAPAHRQGPESATRCARQKLGPAPGAIGQCDNHRRRTTPDRDAGAS
jgi:ParB-like nuclease domain